MEFVVRAVTEEEEKYTERPGIITGIQTGCLGNLMSDTGRYGRGFFLNWHDFNRMIIPKDFKSELTEMEMTYRKRGEFLSCRSALIRFCQTLKCCRKDGRTFGLRIDSDDYAYLCSIDPNEKDDTFYCFVYKKECLKRHMREAENGIRFVLPDNTELFRIKDGDSISITYPDGRCVKEECRYIDSEHFLIRGGHCLEYSQIQRTNERTRCKGYRCRKIKVMTGYGVRSDYLRKKCLHFLLLFPPAPSVRIFCCKYLTAA